MEEGGAFVVVLVELSENCGTKSLETADTRCCRRDYYDNVCQFESANRTLPH